MIIQRLTLAVVSIALLASAASLSVFAAGFAVYALLRPILTPAGAAGAIVFAAAVVAAIAAFLLSRSVRAPARRPVKNEREASGDMLDRVVELARERPIIAAAAALASGLLAVANPALVTAAITAFLPKRRPPPRR